MTRRILIIDDDEEIRETLGELLSDEGFEVVEAGDGVDALALLAVEAHPHLILLDLMMPNMDGWKFHSELQKDSALASIPVVVMTAAGRSVISTIDVTDVIHKPFSLEEVMSVISRYCQHPRAAETASRDGAKFGER
jgi:CheY-like chemotaxis protein